MALLPETARCSKSNTPSSRAGGALDLRTERLGLVLSAQPKDKTLLDVTASLQVEGTLHDPEIELISTDVVFGATQILLGVANPFSLLGSFVRSSDDNANTACETALRAAQEKDARGSGSLLRSTEAPP